MFSARAVRGHRINALPVGFVESAARMHERARLPARAGFFPHFSRARGNVYMGVRTCARASACTHRRSLSRVSTIRMADEKMRNSLQCVNWRRFFVES